LSSCNGYLFFVVNNACLPSACEYAGFFIFSQLFPSSLQIPSFRFRHHAFQIMSTDLLEESLADAFDVLGVDNALAVA
jgi:hypothetical protein